MDFFVYYLVVLSDWIKHAKSCHVARENSEQQGTYTFFLQNYKQNYIKILCGYRYTGFNYLDLG